MMDLEPGSDGVYRLPEPEKTDWVGLFVALIPWMFLFSPIFIAFYMGFMEGYQKALNN